MARLVFLLVLLIVLVALLPGGAVAQTTPPTGPAPAPGTSEPKPPIFQFFLAGGILALIVAIVCMPTRKSR